MVSCARIVSHCAVPNTLLDVPCDQRDQPFPQRIFQTWKSKLDIPNNFRYWQGTFLKQHPDAEYTLWDDDDNRRFIAEHYPWFLETYDSYDMNIKRADAVRYFYLYKYGGIYADMDFECLRNFGDLLERYKGFDVILGSMDTKPADNLHSIPNAIMISKPNAPFWLTVFELLIEYRHEPHTETATGPILLKRAVNKYYGNELHKGSVCILEPSVFYPISWSTKQSDRQMLLNSDDLASVTKYVKDKYPKAYAVTYWTHSWGFNSWSIY